MAKRSVAGVASEPSQWTLPDLIPRLAGEPAMAEVLDALRQGQSATIDGTWGSSRGLAIAALAQARSTSPIVVVLPHTSDLEPLQIDLRSFLRRVSTVFPAIDGWGRAQPGERDFDEPFGRRLAVVKSIGTRDEESSGVFLTTIQAMLQPVPTVEEVRLHSRPLRVGDALDIEELTGWLIARGWHRRDAVEDAGEFSLRGGILDLFARDAEQPVRLELFGDEIDSIREFDVETQRSLRSLREIELTALYGDSWLAGSGPRKCHADVPFPGVAPPGTWFVLVEPNELRAEAKAYASRIESTSSLVDVDRLWRAFLEFPTIVLSNLPYGSLETTCSLQIESIERFSGEVAKVRDELDRVALEDTVLIACHNEAEEHRLREILASSLAGQQGRLHFSLGNLSAGFRWVTERLVALSDNELFSRAEVVRQSPRRRKLQGRAIDSFTDLADGDYVVHLSHGIGIFRGMKMLEKNHQLEEHLIIEFAEKTLVYVPASKIDLVQRYVGASQTLPRLSKIGGIAWEKRKKQVERAVEDMASELLEVQAQRQTRAGIAYPPDSAWQQEFEAAFPFQETPDQLAAIEEIREDMESPRPMDRLICGDVGFGKTELAMRAAFKAVDSGKQVAVLVPTTVLAHQHLRSFRSRMAEYPFTIEVISRFCSKQEQRDVLKRTKSGGVDILIGTHRILSADVEFHDLGLVVVDEEQRFGVEHKERLKMFRQQVDVLTMTATPIPRTLHFSLLGIRDISNLETPPPDRMATETRIIRFDEAMVRHAILRELNRDGQIYFVHNRVKDIQQVAERLRRIVPEVRIAILHGQMREEEIEDGMLSFLERQADMLLATTIIESGLDIPNANTIFIDEGDIYGLADLHQLRGRVGRSSRRAYCYIIVDEHRVVNPDAQRRLKAIEEYSSLGAGFKIALRDLEIRGAGNILGREQSGHIAAVGYELYCTLLERSVRKLKRMPLRTFLDVTVELPWKAFFPAEYLPGERHRIDAYRRLARIRDLDELEEFRRELADRFGPPPEMANHLLELAELRILAQVWQIEAARPDDKGEFLVLTYRNRRRVETLVDLRGKRIIIADDRSIYIRLAPADRTADRMADLLKSLLQPS